MERVRDENLNNSRNSGKLIVGRCACPICSNSVELKWKERELDKWVTCPNCGAEFMTTVEQCQA